MKTLEMPPCMATLLPDCDHSDLRSITGAVDLETFVKNMLTYQPMWLRALYRVREAVAKVFGLAHDQSKHHSQAGKINLAPGGEATFFHSTAYQKGDHWLGIVQDAHMNAWLGVIRESPAQAGPDNAAQFHILTAVKHLSKTGPVYFALIKPFHNLIVRSMVKAGVRD